MITFKVDNLKNMNSSLEEFLNFLKNKGIPSDDIFDSRLVSCELITNVFRHSGNIAVFEGNVSDEFIKITVTGEKAQAFVPQIKLPDVFAESGRGLYIIKSICFGDIKTEGGSVSVKIKIKNK